MLCRYITNNIQEDTGLSEKSTDTLVVYFSWSGNTEEMASYIAKQTGGELLELEPLNAYPDDYTETGNIAREERDYNERPAIANLPDSIEEYDTILVGYPIWWHTAPMIYLKRIFIHSHRQLPWILSSWAILCHLSAKMRLTLMFMMVYL